MVLPLPQFLMGVQGLGMRLPSQGMMGDLDPYSPEIPLTSLIDQLLSADELP